ncbi:diguanylate cyclase/phosphodiesterase with PAS/PAC sensor [Chondrocystis sp. NIES-4102]|nr:diguanylate cyclase/phosphodiesterase with PAS/PAC sensor [Chondrocystis sp. NIES-4102]
MSYSRALLINIITLIGHWSTKSGSFIFCGLFWCNLGIAKANAENNVLVIHSYDRELSETKQQQIGIEQGFAETNSKTNIFHEFLDGKTHPHLEHRHQFISYINKKYQRLPIDLLMVVGDPSLNLILQQHDRYFSNIPVVFLGINNLRQDMLDTPWLTGVVENPTVKDTAIEATRQMWTDTIIVINDTTEMGKVNLEQIAEIKQIRNKALKVEVVNDLFPQEIKNRLGQYPDNVPILLLGQLRQNNNSRSLIDPQQDAEILQSRIPNPIYTENAVRLGRGVVGGKVFDADYHTRQAVELAQKILNGVKPDEIGPILMGKNRWVFDYRQLLRYNIQLDLLPNESELLYLEPPFYVRYRTLVIIIALSFLSTILTIVLLMEKIRKRAIANRILQENEQRYKDLAEAGANVFWELDAKLRYSYISGDIKDLCGLQPASLLGRYPPDLHRDNTNLDVDWELFEQITKERKPFKNFTFSLQDEEGVRIFKINGNPLFDQDFKFIGYRGVKQEITAEQNLYKKIAYQATYDDLTGLINRREFNEKLKYSVQRAQKYRTEAVLCYLDLDRFKIVNDTAGHLIGDRLLSELAQLLQSMIRKGDTLGRLGGDEFGLLLEGCSITEAEQICEQLISTINNYRLKWNSVEFDVGVSIGIVGITSTSTDATEILSRADVACYQAKNLGRGRIYVVENNHQEIDLEQTKMGHIANVSQAIKENRFYLVKQLIKPIVDDGQQRQHYEILLRLKDRTGKLVTPEQFIPVAERYGVITIVDRWVLEATLKSYARNFAPNKALVSINLSGASINDERFTNYAIDLIRKSNVPGECLCFEITETAAIAQITHAQKFIKAMKNLGVKFALDDFGSGVSSFTYLKNLAVDYLKIDGSLVKNILNEECDRAIVNSINEVAHLMGIKTIAEFVENDQILKHLSEISIDYAQGYIMGKPIDLNS